MRKFRNEEPNVNFFMVSVALETKIPAIVATEVFIRKDCCTAWAYEGDLKELKNFLDDASECNAVLVEFDSRNLRERKNGTLNVTLSFKDYKDFERFCNMNSD